MSHGKISMKDIAEELGISINAVSLSLNDRPGVSVETREKVFETALRLGYLQSREKYQILYARNRLGLFVRKKDFQSRFYSRVIYGIEQEATKENFSILTRFLEDRDQWLECLQKNFFRGILVVGNIDEPMLEEIASYHIPMVLVDVESYTAEFDTILTQNHAGTYHSVSYLLDNGFQTIGFFGDYSFSHSNKERFWGYLEALADGLGSLEAAIQMSDRCSILEKTNDLIIDRNVAAVEEIIRRHKDRLPQAFQCANDEHAAVFATALKDLGYRIPDDISLIGFDDSDVGTIVLPKLTTLHVKRDRMGREAVSRLITRLRNHDLPAAETALPVDLVIRDSVAKLPEKERA